MEIIGVATPRCARVGFLELFWLSLAFLSPAISRNTGNTYMAAIEKINNNGEYQMLLIKQKNHRCF